MYKYRLHVWWSDEDQAWLVDVPDLPGAMADGKTPEEAVANAQAVIENWIAVAQELGRDVPPPAPSRNVPREQATRTSPDTTQR